MAVNFSDNLYLPNFNQWSRPITVTPLVSQPGAPAYGGRGILDTKETDVLGEDGSVYSDSKTILDILMDEFPILPMQGDQIDIPYHQKVAGGSFLVADLAGVGNAGGEITITLERIVTAKP